MAKITKADVDGEVAQLEASAVERDPSPSHLDVVARSRVRLVNVLTDEVVADLGRDHLGQAPALVLTYLFCRQVFVDVETLYATLCAQPWSTRAWTGARASIRSVNGRLERRLRDSTFCLAYEGMYGFLLRATEDQRAEMAARREQRTSRAKRTRRERWA